MTSTFTSRIAMDAKYTDSISGFTGKVCCVAFYATSPERVQLAALKNDGSVAREWFDAPSLVPA